YVSATRSVHLTGRELAGYGAVVGGPGSCPSWSWTRRDRRRSRTRYAPTPVWSGRWMHAPIRPWFPTTFPRDFSEVVVGGGPASTMTSVPRELPAVPPECPQE